MTPTEGLSRWKWPAIYAAVAILTCVVYLFAAQREFALGFPLDDAWIHQTYARNLVELRTWTFQPGPTSGGSTSPLWTMLLAAGAALGLDPRIRAYILGGVALFFTALLSREWLGRRLSNPAWAWTAGVVVLLEWHLAWAGLSGMETILQSLLVVGVFLALEARQSSPLTVGALIGLGMWIRPDALSLIVPLVWLLAWDPEPVPQRLRSLILAGAGMALLVVPYLAFNRLVGGEWWPTTFYAKQAEYAVLRQSPIASRLLAEFVQPMIGVGIMLLPGVVLATSHSIRTRRLGGLAPLVWVVAFMSMYALRLPVTYQHGRYVIPTVPAVLVVGLDGLISSGWPLGRKRRWRVTSLAWPASVGGVLIGFWLLGAGAYARDVSIIESEMVAASRWIATHTEPNAVVAAHDIGALGYYGDRPILDLAGLVSPDVIPIMRDEGSLAEYLNLNHADYLMTFPGWYPELTRWAQPVFRTGAPFSPAVGGENMVVFRWEPVEFASLDTSMLYSPHSIGGRLEHGDDSGHHR
jgi:hypothetical protein